MRTLIVLVVAAVALAGCGHKKRARVTPLPRPSRIPVVVQPGDTEEGVASWYGHPYHGRPAANGEIYDMEKMTAAHRTLPFDTWVRVYDLDNNRTTEVRITDRGPFVGGRIIDLSHAAARELELIGPGVARVRIEVVRTPPNAAPGLFAVQVGAFRDRANAERLRVLYEVLEASARGRSVLPMVKHSERVARERHDGGFDLAEVLTAFNVLEEALWRQITKLVPPREYPDAFGLVSTILGAGKQALALQYVALARQSGTPALDVDALFAGSSI